MHNHFSTLVNTTNQELQTISIWFKANKLSLNVTKTNNMIFLMYVIITLKIMLLLNLMEGGWRE